MSTKSNENAAGDQHFHASKNGNMLFRQGLLADLGLEFACFSRAARIFEGRAGGAGIILGFEHVRPRSRGSFRPLQWGYITPEFLDRTIAALKRWHFDILSIDEAAECVQRASLARRFVCLTFDGGHRDFMDDDAAANPLGRPAAIAAHAARGPVRHHGAQGETPRDEPAINYD